MLSKKLNIERIIIGILLIIVGFALMTLTVWMILKWLEITAELTAVHGGSIKYSFYFIEFHHGIIASLFAIIGGMLLLVKSAIGWTLGITMSVTYSITFLYNLFRLIFSKPESNPADADLRSNLIIPLLIFMSLLFILSTLFLSLKRTRLEFGLSKFNYGIAYGLIIVLIIDRVLF